MAPEKPNLRFSMIYTAEPASYAVLPDGRLMKDTSESYGVIVSPPELCSLNKRSERPVSSSESDTITPGEWEPLGPSDPPIFNRFRRPVAFDKKGKPVAYEFRSDPI
jgi:hypothetical protein